MTKLLINFLMSYVGRHVVPEHTYYMAGRNHFFERSGLAPILTLNDQVTKTISVQAECIPHLLKDSATFWVWPQTGAEKRSILSTLLRIAILS